MHVQTLGRFNKVTIQPGEYFVSGEATTISTLLGSCVAACLFDPASKVIGMNHFLLSNRRYSRDLPIHVSEAGRYGIHAMELLINDMLKMGAERKNIKAKAFGGASIIQQSQDSDNFTCVGEVNCRFIREFLSNERIQLVSQDLGGEKGRVVHFSNGDFAVHVRKVERQKSARLATRDHECWLRAIEMQEQTLLRPDLWL